MSCPFYNICITGDLYVVLIVYKLVFMDLLCKLVFMDLLYKLALIDLLCKLLFMDLLCKLLFMDLLVIYPLTQIFKRKHCPKHIFYAIWCRITKLGVVVHHGMGQCRVSYLGHCDLLFHGGHFVSKFLRENIVYIMFPQHIFYAAWCRITKLGVVVHHGIRQCHVPYVGHCELLHDSNHFVFKFLWENVVHSLSFILFHAGSPNLVW